MTTTENIMEVCRVRTEYENFRYLKHADNLPSQLTVQSAYDIVNNRRWCEQYPGVRNIANRLLDLKKGYNNG